MLPSRETRRGAALRAFPATLVAAWVALVSVGVLACDGSAGTSADTRETVDADPRDSRDSPDVADTVPDETARDDSSEAVADGDTESDSDGDPDGDIAAHDDTTADTRPDIGPEADAAGETTPPDDVDGTDLALDAPPETDGDLADTQDNLDTGDAGPTDASPTCAAPCATGRIRFERRGPNATWTALTGPALVPLADHPVAIGETYALTDAEGRFALPLPPGVTCQVTVVASRPRDPGAPFGPASVAVLDGVSAAIPSSFEVEPRISRTWAFTAPCEPDVQLDLVIGIADGSGALAILDTVTRARGAFVGALGETPLTLALIWSPGRTWSCGSCYLDQRYRGVTLDTGSEITHFDRAIFVSGSNATPHHWSPSVLAHELSHFALESWSKPPAVGGSHGFDRRVEPVLAFSEGAATFLGQWSLAAWSTAPSRFFAVQQGVQYWVDLEAIGRAPNSDDSNLDFTVPLPRPADPLDQPLSEAVVAAALWDLMDDEGSLDPGHDLVALAIDAVLAFASPRLVGPLDRGGAGPDLVDYLDALRCEPSYDAALGGPPSGAPPPPTALAGVLLGFPYDDAPLCPLPPARSSR